MLEGSHDILVALTSAFSVLPAQSKNTTSSAVRLRSIVLRML